MPGSVCDLKVDRYITAHFRHQRTQIFHIVSVPGICLIKIFIVHIVESNPNLRLSSKPSWLCVPWCKLVVVKVNPN